MNGFFDNLGKNIVNNIKNHKSNFIMTIVSVILIISAFIIMDDISFPLFGMGIIILGTVFLKKINNKNL